MPQRKIDRYTMEWRIKNNKKDTTHHDVNGWFFWFRLEVRRWCLTLDGWIDGWMDGIAQ